MEYEFEELAQQTPVRVDKHGRQPHWKEYWELLKTLAANFYVQTLVFLNSSLIFGILSLIVNNSFWNGLFLGSLLGGFACGFVSKKIPFMGMLAVGTNLLARFVLLLDPTPNHIFYFGFVGTFFASLAALLGAVLGCLCSKFKLIESRGSRGTRSEGSNAT